MNEENMLIVFQEFFSALRSRLTPDEKRDWACMVIVGLELQNEFVLLPEESELDVPYYTETIKHKMLNGESETIMFLN